MNANRKIPRILILGGGYVGLHAARQIRQKLGRREAAIVVVDPRSYMTYQPFLPEAAAGSIEPRHVVASLRKTLKGATVITGSAVGLDHTARTATIRPAEGEDYTVSYDQVVVALGAVSRTLPIPGLAEHGNGFKQIEEAIALRNRVLGKMDAASSTWDPELRKRMLTFTFVGGGFAGVEALAEIEDMARTATAEFDSIRPEDLRFVLIEGSDKILPEVGTELGTYALKQLRERGIEVKLSTFLDSAVDGLIETSDGDTFASDTLVWTAGVKANPMLEHYGLPLDERGRVITNAYLEVCTAQGEVVEGAWAAGDNAAVPDLAAGVAGATCGPTAQHAIRQAALLGDNLVAKMLGRPMREYKHKNLGTVAALGLYKGVATVFGLKLRGFPAWFMHRTYHVMAMPTINRKARILLDWTLALLFKRELVSLGSLEDPRKGFESIASPAAKPPTA